jgi:hypothetical protein
MSAVTPHGIQDDMTKLRTLFGENLFDRFSPEAWQLAEHMLERSVVFEYGPATPSVEHTQFGSDLFDKQLFRLPFKAVFYTANAIPRSAILAYEAEEDDGYRLFMITFGPVGIQGHDTLLVAPLLTARMRWDAEKGGWIDWKSCTAGQNHHSRKTGRKWEEEDYEAAIDRVINFTMGATALLMSKEVTTDVVPAPDRLNKQREAKGRLPIRERRVIRIRPEYKAAHARSAEGFNSRSSPRMHWRRGHLRRVREDLVIPIAPMLINATEDAKPLAKKYVFSQP